MLYDPEVVWLYTMSMKARQCITGFDSINVDMYTHERLTGL